MSFSSPRASSALSITPIPEVSLPSARNPTSWSFARLCGRPSMLHWLSPPSASTGPRRSSSTTAWKAGGKIGRMPTGRVQCRRTNLGPASSVGIIVNGGFLRTSCTQGSSLACPWLSRLSTGILSEALGRRLLFLLVSLYFDDAHLTDWSSSKGSGQQAFRDLNEIMGSPFAEDKRQDMAPTGTFLGLDFDLSEISGDGTVAFWVRSRLQEKVEDMLATAERTGVLPPGVASKLYGVLNFLEQGMYGRVGTGGLQALKARQTEKVVELTGALRQSMEVIRAVLAMRPRRRVEVFPSEHCRFVAASDAAEDVPGEGTGGFLLVWRSGLPSREAFVAEVSPSVYSLFTPGDHKIAQLELSMVLYALTARPSRFRGARGVWYIDNVAALMCLIRGRSDSPDLERMANLIHVALFALQTWIYWEWIPSKSNWSDSISRLGRRDPWHRMHHFKCFPAYFPASLWRLPLRPVTLIFELL